MIPKIGKSGHSFNGLANYLTHDPKADSAERVAWTHTENLANDHLPAAVSEMLWTYRDAELLKQEAGIRAGGRASEHPVKHISLNWAPSDNPSQQHMLATAQHYLKTMGWDEHQAIIVAHNDKAYKHLHIMINEIHPETGLRLNDGFEQRRSQKWALAYEQAQGQIHCEQRTLDPSDRQSNMPRNMWMEFKQNEKEFQKSEEKLRKNSEIKVELPENQKNPQREILKQFQRDERDQFFADYRERFSEMRSTIYREVKEEFRKRWGNYFETRKNAPESERENLVTLKSELVADQKAAFEPRREAAYAELKEQRNLEYRELLDVQKLERSELAWHLKVGFDTTDFFQELGSKRERRDAALVGFHEAASEIMPRVPQTNEHAVPELGAYVGDVSAPDHAPSLEEEVIEAADLPRRAIVGSAGAFFDALFTDLTNLGSAPKTNEPVRGARDAFEVAAEEATKERVAAERVEEDVQAYKRSREIYRE